MPPALDVEDLAKRYGERDALDGVNLTVEESECVAVLGPNGAGKSTLLECVATIRTPTRGTVRVHGKAAGEDPMRVRKRMGVAFQQPLASKHLTAREVLLHHARLYAVPRSVAEGRAEQMLEFVDLEDRAGDRVGTFSGGMKRRVDLARVLMTDPELILLDEPTAGLDPRGRDRFHERLLGLGGEGRSLLLATHDLEEAQRLADRVCILDRGSIVASGAPEDLVQASDRRVVEVSVGQEGAGRARDALGGLGVDLVDVGDRLEARTSASEGASPADVVDALERSGVEYEEVRVREADLGDVFLEVTGRRFDAGGAA